jgi:outer membrane autotransporter protein
MKPANYMLRQQISNQYKISLKALMLLYCASFSGQVLAYGIPNSPGGAIDTGAPPPVNGVPDAGTLPSVVVSNGLIGFSNGTINVAEDAGSVRLAVVRSGGDRGAVSVDFNVVDGSAVAGVAYQTSQGALQWADGESGSKTITIEIINNRLIEDDKQFSLSLNNFTGGVNAGLSLVNITITNDDTRRAADLLDVAKNPTQLAMALTIVDVLDKGMPTPELERDLIDLVDNVATNKDQVSEALQQIAPEEYLAQGRMALELGATQVRNIDSRLHALRRGVRCIDASGLNTDMNDAVLAAESLFTPDDLCHGGKEGASQQRLGLFINGDWSTGERDVTNRESAFSFDTKNITLGADYRITDYSIIGVAVGLSKVDLGFDKHYADMKADGQSISLFGTIYETDKFYFDAIIGYGKNDFDNNRYLDYRLDGTDTQVNQTLSSSNTTTQTWASIGIGAFSPLGHSVLLTHTLNLDYISADIEGLEERVSNVGEKGDALALAVNGYELDTLRFRVGWRLSREALYSWGSIMPYASIQGVAEKRSQRHYLTGHFLADAAQNTFNIGSDTPDNFYAHLGLGLLLETKTGLSAYMSYEKLIEQDNAQRDSFTLGIRAEF